MVYKVAAASSDGKVINQHFGQAHRFFVAEIDTDTHTYEWIATREVSPACKTDGHSEEDFKRTLAELYDCKLLLVSRIGPAARAFVEEQGIKVIEVADLAQVCLEKIAKSRVVLFDA
ncbi:MAG: NifB/NifX family molybdenum-iron cluster-binding protein [Lachnospiraceae bacterium]